MPIELWQGLLIPFAGTTLGAACVFFMRNNLGEMVQHALTGFAAGVMVAASIWSLLLPAMEQAADMGRWSFVPAVAGFWLGILFLLGLDRLIPHLHRGSAEAEGIKSSLGKTTMLTLAVALHNIPEGMAVGAVYAGWLYGDSGITLAGALPFGNSSFDIVLSLNGFHAFPDKEAAWREIFRVLRPGGTFCGCFYVRGQNRRTDWIIRRLYVPKGWFTPPFETAESLWHRLEETFGPAKVRTVQGIASFVCRKAKEKHP